MLFASVRSVEAIKQPKLEWRLTNTITRKRQRPDNKLIGKCSKGKIQTALHLNYNRKKNEKAILET